MTVIPPTAAPPAPAAKTAGTGAAGTPSGEAGEDVAAIFSAMVAAVSAELAASEQTASAGEGEVLAAGPDGASGPDDPTATVPETDGVTPSVVVASLLGTTAAPSPPATGVGSTDLAKGAGASVAAITTTSPPPATDDLAGPETLGDLPNTAVTVDGALTEAVPEEVEAPLGDLITASGPDPDATVDTDAKVDATVGPDATADVEPPAATPDEPARPDAAPVDADATVEADIDTDGSVQQPLTTTAAAPVSSTDGAVAAVAPTPGGTTTVAATTAASGIDRPAVPALPDQLVEVLAPLRRAPDGTHRMAIQLRPDELGDVHIEFQVRGNEISLNLRADLASTNDLLRESLAQLRAELDAAGFQSGTLDVADHGEARGRAGKDDASDAGDASADQTPSAERRSMTAAGETRLDLRL